MNNKNDWINEDIKIDFCLPIILKNEIEECERLAKENDYEFFPCAYNLDAICKGLVGTGHLTQEQWDIICARYNC